MLLDVLDTYVGRIRPGHSEVQRDEIKRHLAQTLFAWMGGADDGGVFYYRIHSPVILIEFDHQRGIAFDNDAPSRQHIHTVVRTPNGNDYGRDLLRQHHARFDHTQADAPPLTKTAPRVVADTTRAPFSDRTRRSGLVRRDRYGRAAEAAPARSSRHDGAD